MPNIDHLIAVVEEQESIVLALENPKIDEAAKHVAYYHAMLDACLSEPLDDPEDQNAMLAYIRDNLAEHTDVYQQLVNDML